MVISTNTMCFPEATDYVPGEEWENYTSYGVSVDVILDEKERRLDACADVAPENGSACVSVCAVLTRSQMQRMTRDVLTELSAKVHAACMDELSGRNGTRWDFGRALAFHNGGRVLRTCEAATGLTFRARGQKGNAV